MHHAYKFLQHSDQVSRATYNDRIESFRRRKLEHNVVNVLYYQCFVLGRHFSVL